MTSVGALLLSFAAVANPNSALSAFTIGGSAFTTTAVTNTAATNISVSINGLIEVLTVLQISIFVHPTTTLIVRGTDIISSP